MNKIILTLMVSFITMMAYGQVDKEKMKKDLEVAENVLQTVIEQNAQNRFFWRYGDYISSSYRDDYGVTFTIEDQFPVVVKDGFVTTFPGEQAQIIALKEAEVKEKLKEKELKVKELKEKEIEEKKAMVGRLITTGENNRPDIKESFITFLKDYHTLIRQLQPNDKIVIKKTTGSKKHTMLWVDVGRKLKTSNGLMVEAIKKDLDDYTTGKIDDEVLISKIKIKEINADTESEPDLEVFGSVMSRLYGPDLSSTYYMNSNPWYDRIDDYGVTFYFKFYSSTEMEGRYLITTIEKDVDSKEERNAIVNDMYPKFLEGLKENILDYAHLIKSIKDDETLYLNVNLTECDDCAMPKEIELSIKKSVIDQYRDEKVNKNIAKEKFELLILED